jgi:hypothetical protein
MKRWVGMTRLLKVALSVGPYDFFMYLELVWCCVFCICSNPFRWKWALFVFFGLGFVLLKRVVHVQKRIRNGVGLNWDQRLENARASFEGSHEI